MVSYLKHPMVLALTGLIAVLVPGLVLLGRAYDEARDRYFDSSLPAVPTDKEIAALARRLSPEETVLRLTGKVHVPDSPPRSGLVRVDAATDDRGGEYYVAVIRHDIACATCNNLLMAVLVSTDDGEIREVVALAPWELRGEPMDPGGFLTQFAGRLLTGDRLTMQDVDGISGATLTVNAFLHQLMVLGQWMNDRHPGDEKRQQYDNG